MKLGVGHGACDVLVCHLVYHLAFASPPRPPPRRPLLEEAPLIDEDVSFILFYQHQLRRKSHPESAGHALGVKPLY